MATAAPTRKRCRGRRVLPVWSRFTLVHFAQLANLPEPGPGFVNCPLTRSWTARCALPGGGPVVGGVLAGATVGNPSAGQGGMSDGGGRGK